MADFNGVNYGTSIPPSPKPYRGPGCGGCHGCFSSCCSFFFNCILGVICNLVASIVLIGVIVLLFWLIVRPNMMKFHVTNATLTQFNYTNNTLHYNLTLNISIRNPNERVGIYYDYIETSAWYHDVRFGYQTLGTFFQNHKNTSVLSPVFKGQQVMPLNKDQTSELNDDNSSGVYNIDVRLYLKVRFRFGFLKTVKVKPKLSCDLQVPLKSHNGTEFQTTECDWDYRWLRIPVITTPK